MIGFADFLSTVPTLWTDECTTKIFHTVENQVGQTVPAVITSGPHLDWWGEKLSQYPPMRAFLKHPFSLKDLLDSARVRVYSCDAMTLNSRIRIHSGDDRSVKTPLEFVHDYRDILLGKNTQWALVRAEVDFEKVSLFYVRRQCQSNSGVEKPDEIGIIEVRPYGRSLYLELPESSDSNRGLSGLWRLIEQRDQPTAPQSSTPTITVAIRCTDVNIMEIAVCPPDDSDDDKSLLYQRILRVTKSGSSDATVFTRSYAAPLSGLELSEVLKYDSAEQAFYL